MYPFTTPRHRFKLPANMPAESIEAYRVTYSQAPRMGSKPIKMIVKTEADGVIENGYICVRLTQAETNMFKRDSEAFVQLHLRTQDGQAMQSPTFKLFVHNSLDDQEI